MARSRVAIWTMSFDAVPWTDARDAVRAAEEAGWRTLWLPESFGREVISLATACLASTSRLEVATGIANVWARDALALTGAQRFLCEAFPDRFLLGVGVSHQAVASRRGGNFAEIPPLQRMRAYLDAMDAAPYRGLTADVARPRVIAALGPRMLALARERADGAHTYNAPPAHTAWARQILGPDRLLVPELKVVLGRSTEASRSLARKNLPVTLPAYAANLARSGFGPEDLADGPSDRVVDALVAYGDVDAVRARVAEHLQAGADQVALNVLTEPGRTPGPEWELLAALARETMTEVP
jgi:probable F420-dependent oxidoreductase